MRVAMYYKNSDIRVEEMPVPTIGDNEILVKVHACGVCGSDVMEWYRIKTAPRVLGHEVAGEIVAVGDKELVWEPGQRVFVTHHVPCGECHYCRMGHGSTCDTLRSTNFYPGGFSEFLRVPQINVEMGLFELPDNVSYIEGTFIEPLACVARGQRHAGFAKGKTVLVLGAGISGMLHIALAHATEAAMVIATDISEERLKMAKEFGADHTINAKENVVELVKEITHGRGADLIITATGAKPALQQAIDSVARGGSILWFAPTDPDHNLEIPFNRFWKDEISTFTSYAGCADDIMAAIDLLEKEMIPVGDMVTHLLPLEETSKGFQLVASAQDSLKVVIEPHKRD